MGTVTVCGKFSDCVKFGRGHGQLMPCSVLEELCIETKKENF